jgi:hypothetical protein
MRRISRRTKTVLLVGYLLAAGFLAAVAVGTAFGGPAVGVEWDRDLSAVGIEWTK